MSMLRVLTLPFASQQAPRAVMIGFALLAGGCASQQAGTHAAVGADDTVQSTGLSFKPVASDSVDAPPDDADQPWSPNYGWQPRNRDSAPSYAPVPVDRIAGPTRYATMDPDAVIRHAVAAHEMRRQ
jgi:hypothetical protein